MKLSFNKLIVSVVLATALLADSVAGEKHGFRGVEGDKSNIRGGGTDDFARRLAAVTRGGGDGGRDLSDATTEAADASAFKVQSMVGRALFSTDMCVNCPDDGSSVTRTLCGKSYSSKCYRPASVKGISSSDQTYMDWGNLSTLNHLDMWNQGNPAGTNCQTSPTVQGKAYVNYECDASKSLLCVLVLAEPGVTMSSAMWIKIFELGNSEITPAQVFKNENGGIVGYEHCFSPPLDKDSDGTCYTCGTGQNANCGVEFHFNNLAGNTISTGKAQNDNSGPPFFLELPRCSLTPCTEATVATACASFYGPCKNVSCVSGSCSTAPKSNCCVVDTNNPNSGCNPPQDNCKQSVCSAISNGEGVCAVVDKPSSTLPPGCTVPPINPCADGDPDECPAVAECQDKSCVLVSDVKQCGATPVANSPTTTCGTYVNEVKDGDCRESDICIDGTCTPQYSAIGTTCTVGVTVPPGGNSNCYKANEGTCQNVAGTFVPVCRAEPDLAKECTSDTAVLDDHVCRDPDTCQMDDSGLAQCKVNYKPSTTVCNPSLGCCDPEEKCTGKDFTCPTDVIVTPDNQIVCRGSCEGCRSDPEEQCMGDVDCPLNVFLDDELCIVAGQFYDAGRVHVIGQEDGKGGYEVCFDIVLGTSWSLGSGEAIKAYIHEGAPPMVHGQYPLKLGTGISGSGGSYTFDAGCFDVTSLVPSYNSETETCGGGGSLSIAIKFDVTGPSGGQTAWAMNCGNILADTDGSPFGDASIQVGNKNNLKPHQWFKYATWSPCCEATCGESCCDGCLGGGGGGGGSSCTASCSCSETGATASVVTDNCSAPPARRRLGFL